MQIQPPTAERPFPSMSIRTFEISAARLEVRGDVPAAAALVGDEG